MPGGDRTGPFGEGAMTGRAAGFCSGNNNPGFWRRNGIGQRVGRDMGCGFSRPGQNRRLFLSQAQMTDNSLESLKEQAAFFKQRLNQINISISELESEK